MKDTALGHSVIGLYGVVAVGKTTLAHELTRVINTSEVQSTDNLIALQRSLHPDDLRSAAPSYLAWTIYGDRTPSNVARGFSTYRESIAPFISTLIERAAREQFTLILDGIHFGPGYLGRDGGISIVPLLLVVKDEAAHRSRIHQKCCGRTDLEARLLEHFDTIRIIQTFLIEEAGKAGPCVVETGAATIQQSLHVVRELLCDS